MYVVCVLELEKKDNKTTFLAIDDFIGQGVKELINLVKREVKGLI